MIGTFNDSNFDFNKTADTVTSSSWLPVGTKFTDIEQGNAINPAGGNNEATLRWDSRDNLKNPLVQYDSGLDDSGSAPPCFTRGTKIVTNNGNRAIEDLCKGDLVLTSDHQLQPIRWIGSRKLSAAELEANPNMRPIRIRAGALGEGTPQNDLVVSPQHRILMRSKIAQRMFGTDEVLIGAKHLLAIDGIEVVEDIQDVEYFHILFSQHQIIFSNGAETESLYTGPQALKSLGVAACEEIFTLFPELKNPENLVDLVPARPFIAGRKGKQFAARHNKHERNLV